MKLTKGHLVLATIIGSLGAVGGGLLMNLVVMLTSKVDLADFRLSVLTKERTTFLCNF